MNKIYLNKRKIKKINKDKKKTQLNGKNKIFRDGEAYDYNRTVEELACLDSLGKVGRHNLNFRNN